MDVTVTVVATATAATADLNVVCPDTSPSAPMLAAIRGAVGAAAGDSLTIAGQPVLADGLTADCGLADGVIVDVGPPRDSPRTTPSALVVASGPGAGRRLPLVAGENVIGRDEGCALVIADPSTSRRHVLITVEPDTIAVTDLDSTNGTTVDGEPLAAQRPIALPPGASLRVGDSELRVERTRARATGSLVHGRRTVHRAPRLKPVLESVTVVFPSPPTPAVTTRVPILAAVAPLVAGVVLAIVLQQWQFLAFTALSPIMIFGQAAGDRRASRRAARLAEREHAVATAAARDELAKALVDERRRRYTDAPDLGELTRAAAEVAKPLWQRGAHDPDAMVLRLGRGDLSSDIAVLGGPGVATVGDVPINVGFREVGVLGVCGPRARTLELARSLVIQATTLHGPSQLRLVILAPERAGDWGWARWLPHTVARDGEDCLALVGFDDDQLLARVGEVGARCGRQAGRVAHTLVIVDATATTRESAALAMLTGSVGEDLSMLWCAEDVGELPGACRAVATLSTTPRVQVRLASSSHAERLIVTPDLLEIDVAESTARALAPLRDDAGTSSDGMPVIVRWEQVTGVDLRNHALAVQSLIRHWSHGPSTAVRLGCDTDGPVTIDLCRDGPHALIAGTTGSGKSELLLSLVASLAALNRPDQLSLLLIDHKGGAAFGPCALLPHTVGVVTDLDGESTRRALLSLTAEIRRREALLATAAATDLDSYQTARSSATAVTEPLARLVIVVDEFATLAEEQPDFVGGLVGIAQRGRSLGIHLVLATQRPDGVVSADIRANTRLRICLGVARDHESRDVIDCPDAATISRTTPGRAYLRVGPGDLRSFQTARIGGRHEDRQSLDVTFSPAAALGARRPAPSTSNDTDATTDLDVLIAAARQASATIGCLPPPPPWLAPLPEHVGTSTLPRDAERRMAPWALLDLPATGTQCPMRIDLRVGGNVLIAGTARSGRTTAARAIAMSAAATVSVDELNIWAIVGGAGLSDVAALSHCGGILAAGEVEEIERLVAHLSQEILRRRNSPTDQHSALMLIIDSWDGLAAAGQDRDGGRVTDGLLRLAADGPAANLHLVITTDRAGLVGRLAAVASEKVILRLADPHDFALIGLPARDLPQHLPPGRGIRAGDLGGVQVAVPDADTIAAAHAWPCPVHPVRRFDPLPDRVRLSDLPSSRLPTPGHLWLGLAVDDLEPVTVDRHDLGASFLVAGPSGSGRSTALLLLARQLTGRRLAISCPHRSPLAGHPGAIWLPREDQDHAAALLDSLCDNQSPPDVLIDDIDLLGEGPFTDRLEQLINRALDTEQVIAMSGSVDAMSAAFRGPMAQARRARTGLLLCPSGPHDGELFGMRLPRRVNRGDPPGRGWLAGRGTSIRLQLANPDTALDATAVAQPRTLLELSGFGGRRLE